MHHVAFCKCSLNFQPPPLCLASVVNFHDELSDLRLQLNGGCTMSSEEALGYFHCRAWIEDDDAPHPFALRRLVVREVIRRQYVELRGLPLRTKRFVNHPTL